MDLWGSVRDPDYNGDTLQTIWSSTKNLAAVAVACLVDRGLLAYTDLVTTHCTMEKYADKLEFLIKALWIAHFR